mmetsp:Transcript_2145/g.6397  ORF Transcript_2145/g.6397 Transcript_2145/m.6397 type:complete len:189 (-) Transcript_2145:27-593(-)
MAATKTAVELEAARSCLEKSVEASKADPRNKDLRAEVRRATQRFHDASDADARADRARAAVAEDSGAAPSARAELVREQVDRLRMEVLAARLRVTGAQRVWCGTPLPCAADPRTARVLSAPGGLLDGIQAVKVALKPRCLEDYVVRLGEETRARRGPEDYTLILARPLSAEERAERAEAEGRQWVIDE